MTCVKAPMGANLGHYGTYHMPTFATNVIKGVRLDMLNFQMIYMQCAVSLEHTYLNWNVTYVMAMENVFIRRLVAIVTRYEKIDHSRSNMILH